MTHLHGKDVAGNQPWQLSLSVGVVFSILAPRARASLWLTITALGLHACQRSVWKDSNGVVHGTGAVGCGALASAAG
jgi:hypothetical protein